MDESFNSCLKTFLNFSGREKLKRVTWQAGRTERGNAQLRRACSQTRLRKYICAEFGRVSFSWDKADRNGVCVCVRGEFLSEGAACGNSPGCER